MTERKDDRPVVALAAIARTFGREAARVKVRLLDAIVSTERFSAGDRRLLLDTLCFLFAYPDDAKVLAGIRRVAERLRERSRGLDDAGYPGGTNFYPFALPVLHRMQRVFPGCFELDWEEFESGVLQNDLGLFVSPAECAGVDSIELSMEEWVQAAKNPSMTDLEFLVSLFMQADADPIAVANMWENADVPVRYRLDRRGTARSEILWPVARTHYQRRPVRNERVALAPAIRRPAPVTGPLSGKRGRALIDFGLTSLCARNLEIRTLMYANENDVHIVDCGRGVQVALVGVVPAYRDALECHYCCFVLKNGIAMAYGPASVHFGCCEMGLNLFPEYRGGEIRWIYPQYMRAIHEVLGARFFFLTSYGMGDGNLDAIRSGAFWFYRKLGFRAANPAVEELARAEEAKMRRRPGYRSDVRTLHRLAPTEAYFDISDGECERFDLPAIGLRVSRMIAAQFAGDRRAAEATCVRRVIRQFDLPARPDESTARALRLLAPILCVIDGFARWTAADKRRMRRIVLAKGRKSEAKVDGMLAGHATLRAALRSFGNANTGNRS